MAGINFNGGSFRPFNLNAVRGMGPIPECDKGKEPKDIKDFRDSHPKES